MTTSAVSRNAFEGDALYQRRARMSLPLLVRQAKAQQTIFYADLATELGMPNPRNLNYVLGSAARTVEDLGKTWRRPVPRLTTVVVDQESLLPGDGIADFVPDPQAFLAASRPQKRIIVDRLLLDVYIYEKWDEILLALGLAPVGSLGVGAIGRHPTSPEGEAHKRLKEFVAAHPEAIGLPSRAAPGDIEAMLPSGDELDVLFRIGRALVGIEVKAANASESEIERGLYQCVKYAALLRAMQRTQQVTVNCETLLILGGVLPLRLRAVRAVLGIETIECITP